MTPAELTELENAARACPDSGRGICSGCGEYAHKCHCDARAQFNRLTNGRAAILSLIEQVRRLEAENEKLLRPAVRFSETKTEPCPACGKFSSIFTAGCDHCDYEDK